MKYILALACLLPGLALAGYAEERATLYEREAAIAKNADGLSAAEQFKALTDLHFEILQLEQPVFGTYIGSSKHQGRWADNSQLGTRRQEAATRNSLAILKGLDRSALSAGEQLNYDMYVAQLQQNVDAQRFRDNLMPINQLSGIQQDAAQALSLMPTRSAQHYDNILARLESLDTVIDNTIEWMQLGLEQGITPPKITLRDIPQQVRNQLFDQPSDSPLLRAFASMPDSIPAKQQASLRQQAEAIYIAEIKPAYERLLSFLETDYLPGARDSIALTALPDGQAWYAYNVRMRTTTDLTPQQIHDIGLSEVKRIRGEMEAVMRAVDFDGDLAAFFEFLRTDPQFYHTDADALIAEYRAIAKRADPEMVKLFGKLPRTPYGVVKVPAYAEKSQTTAYYQPGSMESGRPGNFFANTYALHTRPRWEMEALTLHEAVPGHHHQIALQQELDDLPWFRRYGWGYTAFVEGWGLYSESLGYDMGFYTDPYSRFGALTYEMWRAIRLVVDTGMHALGWSRQQAIDFFKDNAGKTENDIVVEIDRYIVWPGQALAYKIGQLKILELRENAKAELGNAFDIRSFHDTVLGAGAMPLDLLEQRVADWVSTQQTDR